MLGCNWQSVKFELLFGAFQSIQLSQLHLINYNITSFNENELIYNHTS